MLPPTGRAVAFDPVSAPDATQPVGAGSLLCGRYQLIRVVAQGGMATVWEGHDKVLARAVAVKVLHAHLANDRLFLERFRREAISAARLAHPNVVATFDAGVADDGTAFIVMELIRGRTLSAFSAQHRPLPVFVVIAVGLQITDALVNAHGAGLVHRDIKPANVLVCDDETGGMPLVKVTDFGIAKAAEGLGLELTKTGIVLGTPKYLSPEQVDGREPDARTDLYSLGVVLFELLAGEVPFKGPTELAVAVQHLNAIPPHVLDLRPGIPPALDALVDSLLAKRPEDRPRSALAVRQALAAIDPDETRSAAAVRRPGPSDETGRSPATGSPTGVSGGVGGAGDGRPASAGGVRAAVAPTLAGGRVPAAPTRVSPRPPGSGTGRGSGGGSGGGRQPPAAGGNHQRPQSGYARPPARKANWAGRLVAALVIAALAVVIVVLAGRSRGANNPLSTPGTAASSAPIPIQDVAVFRVDRRSADDAAGVRNAIDGNPNTVWHTDSYFSAHWGNLRTGLGLAATLADVRTLHSLTVTSPTVGWSAEVYVTDAVPTAPSLAPWGPPVASKQAIDGSVTFDLSGHRGRAVLLWLTDPGPANQAAVAEMALR